MDRITEFLQSLLSRKFLIAVTSALAFIAKKQYGEAVIVITGYFGIEGVGDIVVRREKAKQETTAAADKTAEEAAAAA